MAVLVKTINGLAFASVKTRNGLAVGSVAAMAGLDTTSGATTPTLIANTGFGSPDSGSITSGSIDTTGANFIVVAVTWLSGGDTITLTDSKGNTWTATTATTDSGVSVILYYCFGPTVGSGHTFTVTAATTVYPSLCVAAFSGLVTSPFDAQSGASNSLSATLAAGSITPATSTELFVAACAISAGGDLTIDSGFTLTDSIDFLAANHFGVTLAYKSVTNGAANNPTWTSSVSAAQLLARMATFKF